MLRAAIFIDGGYIQSQIKQKNIEADYEELADYFLDPLRDSVPLDLLRCYYYYCPPYMSQEPTEDEIKRMQAHEEFVEDIESLNRWSMRLGKLQKRFDGKREQFEQKRVDVLLSVDLVRHAAAGHIQHAILVAGDSDFVPAIEAAKEHGVTVSLWCGHYTTVHRDLIKLADEVHVFDWDDFPKILPPQSKPQQKQNQNQRQKHRQPRQQQNPQGKGRGGQQGSSRVQKSNSANQNSQVKKSRHPKRRQKLPPADDNTDKKTWGERIKKLADWAKDS